MNKPISPLTRAGAWVCERVARALWRVRVARPLAERLALRAWLARRGEPPTY